ncbi:hypothetical protein EV356DRAFT_347449 [Viridothelium virens]|uniref:PNPLA domain-containing protein n=1 Tax=Viridothelium virens TaxID=1048519 RepID=A0A6A6GX26_VIRVR|nr:hypothetical protein EV356DRAFT_347449 [Viridothelium virens]
MLRGIVPLLNTHPPTPTQEGSLDSSPADTEETHGYPDDEGSQPPLPTRTRVDVSDNDRDSPWSRKMILSLDGGGVKGYSSLLIVKRLMSLVAQIEQGLRPKHKVSSRKWELRLNLVPEEEPIAGQQTIFFLIYTATCSQILSSGSID